jgi:hypothetical protein
MSLPNEASVSAHKLAACQKDRKVTHGRRRKAEMGELEAYPDKLPDEIWGSMSAAAKKKHRKAKRRRRKKKSAASPVASPSGVVKAVPKLRAMKRNNSTLSTGSAGPFERIVPANLAVTQDPGQASRARRQPVDMKKTTVTMSKNGNGDKIGADRLIKSALQEIDDRCREPARGWRSYLACILSCGVTGCEYSFASGGRHESKEYNCNPTMHCCWMKATGLNPCYPCCCFCHPCFARSVHTTLGAPFRKVEGW